MPAERLSMRKTQEILRLRWGLRALAPRDGGPSCGIGRHHGARLHGPGDGGRADLAAAGGPRRRGPRGAALPAAAARARPRRCPTSPRVYRELKRRGVTLELLWQEYRQEHPDDGYGYSRFCDLYREWRGAARRGHAPGASRRREALRRLRRDDPRRSSTATTGEVQPHAGLRRGARRVELHLRRGLRRPGRCPSWIEAHVHAYEYIGGVPAVTVPDNLEVRRSRGPTSTSPISTAAYARDGRALRHRRSSRRGSAVRGTRPRSRTPCSRSSAGCSPRCAIRRFFSRAEAERGDPRAPRLAQRPAALARLDGTRRSLWRELDRPALQPLPAQRFELPEWKVNVGVNIDYHVEFDHHFYSVPYPLVAPAGRCARHGDRWSRSSTRAAASPRICRSALAAVTTPRTAPTCPMPTAATATGPRRASSAGPRRSAPRPPRRSRDVLAPPTPSRAGLPLLSRHHPARRAATAPPRVELACRRARAIGAPSYRSVAVHPRDRPRAASPPPPDPRHRSRPPRKHPRRRLLRPRKEDPMTHDRPRRRFRS